MGRIPVDYIERCYAGWLGKIIGVRHGAPIEGWTYEIRPLVSNHLEKLPNDFRLRFIDCHAYD